MTRLDTRCDPHRDTRRRGPGRFGPTALLVAAVLLSACGGSGDDTTAAATPATSGSAAPSSPGAPTAPAAPPSSSSAPSTRPPATTPPSTTPPSGTPPPTGTSPVASGQRWSDPATWGGSVPATGASVRVPPGKTIVLDTRTAALSALVVEGELVADPAADVSITSDYVLVAGSGAKLQIGTADQPYTRQATITLTGAPSAQDVMGLGTKFLGAMMGGQLVLHGEPRATWTQLAATADAGATQLRLAQPQPSWRPGERILVTSTALDPEQAEERTIRAVSADGATLTLDAALRHRHFGELQTIAGRTVDTRAEVALLARNIVVQGDESSTSTRFGGHVMVMGSSAALREETASARGSARIAGVEFRRLGQFDRLGRYPFHWHRVGLTAGDYLRQSVVHTAIQRGIVVHATDGVTVEGNVVYRVPGHAYMIEDGTEAGNRMLGNLAVLPQAVTFSNGDLKPQNDDRAAGFWIRNGANTLTGNHSAGGAHAGFWFDADEEGGRNVMVFERNVVHSHGTESGTEGQAAAIWATDGGPQGTRQFRNSTLFKNFTGVWTAHESHFSGMVLVDNVEGANTSDFTDTLFVGRSANAAGDDPRVGSYASQVYVGHARLTNVTFTGFDAAEYGALRTLNCRPEGGRFTVRQVRMLTTRVMDFCGGDNLIDDADGSLTGTGQRQKVVPGSPHMRTAACQARPAWGGVYVCPGDLEKMRLQVHAALGQPLATVRSDGVTQTTGDFPYQTFLLADQSYEVRLDASTRASVPVQVDDVPGNGTAAGRSVRVALTASADNLRMLACTGDEPCTSGGTAVGRAASEAELAASPRTAYWVDTARQRVHLKLFLGAYRLERTR